MAKGSKVYRRRPKKVYISEKERADIARRKERIKLYRKTQTQIDQVNKRMNQLLKSGYANTWSSKKLINRLTKTKVSSGVDVIRKRGKIAGVKISPQATNTQLIAINKATRQFLDSKTSTLQGIKSVRNETIRSLKSSLSDFDNELTNEDVEFLYEMLEIQEMQDLTESFGASRIWDISQDAIEANDSKEDFLARFEREIASLNDNDMKKKAERIYEYISKK